MRSVTESARTEVLQARMQSAMSTEWLQQHGLGGIPQQAWSAVLTQLVGVVEQTVLPATGVTNIPRKVGWADASEEVIKSIPPSIAPPQVAALAAQAPASSTSQVTTFGPAVTPTPHQSRASPLA